MDRIPRATLLALLLAFAACTPRTPPAPDRPERPASEPGLRWVEGRVLQGGRPVVGREVSWQPFFLREPTPKKWAMPPFPPTTDAEGRFAVEAPRGAVIYVGAGNEQGTAARVLQPGEPWHRTDLDLQPDGRFEVRVMGPQDEPIRGAEVRLANGVQEYQTALRGVFAASANALGGSMEDALAQSMPPLGEAATAKGPGLFESKPAYAGLWHVLVRAPGFQRAERLVRLRHAATSGLAITLVPAATVEGRVEANGVPLPVRASVAPVHKSPPPPAPADPEELLYESALRGAFALRGLVDPDARTAKAVDGRFSFDDLVPGEYVLSVTAEGAFPEERKVRAPARDVLVSLEPTAALAVDVVDQAGFRLPAKISVQPDPGCRTRGIADLNDPAVMQVARRITPLAQCRYSVKVQSEGCEPAEEARQLGAGETVILLKLRCRDGHPFDRTPHGRHHFHGVE